MLQSHRRAEPARSKRGEPEGQIDARELEITRIEDALRRGRELNDDVNAAIERPRLNGDSSVDGSREDRGGTASRRERMSTRRRLSEPASNGTARAVCHRSSHRTSARRWTCDGPVGWTVGAPEGPVAWSGSRVYPGPVVAHAERLRISLRTSLTACCARVLKGAADGSLLLFFSLLLMGVCFAPGAEAQTSCSYSGATRLLTVRSVESDVLEETGFGVIRRKGSEIVVGELLQPPTPCSGGVPTVFNTDTIRVLPRRGAFVDLRLGGGPFAPGAMPESEGAPEIEIEFSGFFALGTVVGTPGADEFQWGRGGAHAGLNLNPRDAGDEDVDVTARGEAAFLDAHGGAGNDTIIPGPGDPAVPNEHWSDGGPGNDRLIAPRDTDGTLDGGPGNDLITGGRVPDALSGGAGDDQVTGGGGADRMNGGRGHDLLAGGRGRDLIEARDGMRDRVRCGSGRDRVHADRRDRLRGCEVKGPVPVPV
jgi:hypothetical protein